MRNCLFLCNFPEAPLRILIEMPQNHRGGFLSWAPCKEFPAENWCGDTCICVNKKSPKGDLTILTGAPPWAFKVACAGQFWPKWQWGAKFAPAVWECIDLKTMPQIWVPSIYPDTLDCEWFILGLWFIDVPPQARVVACWRDQCPDPLFFTPHWQIFWTNSPTSLLKAVWGLQTPNTHESSSFWPDKTNAIEWSEFC